MKNNNIPKIPAEKFQFVDDSNRLHDQKFDTKQISYFRDAFNRFCKNKSSVTAACIIICLVLYSIVVPLFCETTYSQALTDTNYLNYTKLLPKNDLFADLGLGFWDGASLQTQSTANYNYIRAIGEETGMDVIVGEPKIYKDENGKTLYDIRVDSYVYNGFMYMTFT